MKNNFVITIARQYGCGGRSIGKLLAEKLGIEYLDNELITLAAEKNGVSTEFYKDFDEKASSKFTSIFGYSTPVGGYYMPMYNDLVINDKLYYTQSNIIKSMSVKPCVIVGRCADYILKGNDNLVTIFLHADLETRKERITNKYGVTDKNILKYITKADKRRAQYYNSYTDRTWGEVTNYDVTMNTSRLTIEQIVDMIYSYLQKLPYGD